jgi:hypothetical protein
LDSLFRISQGTAPQDTEQVLTDAFEAGGDLECTEAFGEWKIDPLGYIGGLYCIGYVLFYPFSQAAHQEPSHTS